MENLVETEETCRVYVGNLLPKAKEIHLTSKFSRFGTIHSVWIARRPPGFAFVWFATRDEAERAVEASEDGAMEILGKTVRVQMAGDKKHQNERRDRALKKRHENVNREQRTRRCYERTKGLRGRRRDERGQCRSRSRSRSSDRYWQRTRRGRSRSSCRESHRGSTAINRSRSRSELRRARHLSRHRERRDCSRSRR